MKLVQNAHRIWGPWRGRLAIVPRPRGGDWLEDEISGWREAGIDEVVSFLTPEEAVALDLEDESKLSEHHGIRFYSFPIPDRGVPASVAGAEHLVRDLERSLSQGRNVVLHCRQSIGRSAVIAAELLVRSGDDYRSAFERISSARGTKVPDTAGQEQWVAERDSEDGRTRGERLFERYLWLQGITSYRFEADQTGKTARPDYTVQIDDRKHIFEVKDFTPTDLIGGGAYNPYSRIRQKIDSARKKFKEYKEWPCCLVLYDDHAQLVDLEEPAIMIGSMRGNYGPSYELDHTLGEFVPTTESWGFHHGGSMFRPNTPDPQNTAISALITVRYVEVGQQKLNDLVDRLLKERPGASAVELLAELSSKSLDFDKTERHLGVTVWENSDARLSFPRELFRGSYDVRWGQLESDHEYGVVFRGTAMLDYWNEKQLSSTHPLEPTPQ